MDETCVSLQIQERPTVDSVSSVEGDNNQYDSLITNGMRVMHFMDHHPHYSHPDMFHPYPNSYMPDSLSQYTSYHHHSGSVPTDSFTSVSGQSTASSFTPVVILPQSGLHSYGSNTNNTVTPSNSVGFQPYQGQHHQPLHCGESFDTKRIEQNVKRETKRFELL